MSIEVRSNTDFQGTSLDWLGAFPRRWEVLPGLAVLQERQVKNVGLREKTVLSLSYGRVVVKPEEKLRGLVPESFETYQIVEPGNIIIRPTDLQNDHVSLRVGQVKDKGIITSAYICLETKGGLTPDYAHYLLLGYDLKKVFYGLGSGLRQNLSWTDFRRLPIPVPPPDEQAQIVRFIRHLDHRVNRLIKTKRRLIELLNEQKQAIIHRAVTRGLDPTVPLKPSGIDWLGDAPKHWSVKPLKRWASMNAKTLTDKTPSDFEFRYLDIGTVGTGRLVREPEKMVFEGAPSRARRIVRSGDTIISTVRTYLKAMFFVENVEEPMIASTGFAVLSPTDAIVPRYLSYLIQSADFINRVTANSIGIAYPAISESRMGSFQLAAPGKAEQLEILAHLDVATEPFDSALSKAQSEIDLIREYRTRLVADVVTGQLDVRHLDLPQVEESLIEAIDAGESDDPDEEIEAQEVE